MMLSLDKLQIDYQIHDERWSFYPLDQLEIMTLNILKQLIQLDLDFQSYLDQIELLNISFLFTHDAEIKTLNHTYRQKDKATNVLSFPANEYYEGKRSDYIPIQNLGDMVFSYDTLIREAQEQQKDIKNHFHHLLIHSILHLLGYDHEDDQAADEMEAIEIKILAHFNIPNPY